MTKKVTSAELTRVWELPGYNGFADMTDQNTLNKGGCAVCKLKMLLGKDYEIDWTGTIGQLGISHDMSLKAIGMKYETYTQTFAQTQIHLKFFKQVLQQAIEEGLIELEDDAAKEFSELLKKEEAVV